MTTAAVVGNTAWLAASWPEYQRFKRDARRLEATQRELLGRYLRTNTHTDFGRQHDFAGIGSWEAFTEKVPVRNYDDFEPWISRIAVGESQVLTAEKVRLFEPSSGSSGPAKLIPYTQTLQAGIRRAVAAWTVHNFLSRPALLGGRAYWSLTPRISVAQPDDCVIPVGFDEDSAYLGGIAQRLINRTLATPSALRDVREVEMFWRLTLLYLLQCPDLRLVSVWHPSFLDLLVRRLRDNWASLLRDLESGFAHADSGVKIAANAPLARKLRASGCDDLHRIWPELQLISCWADGHAATGIPQMQSLFPHAEIQGKGLIATEAFITVPIGDQCPLAIRSHVFEFLDDEGRALAPWSVEKGGVYSVVVTNGGGLYRYRLGDRVEVTGFHHDVPCLRFLGKEDQASDYRGEKLTEAFVGAVLQKLFARSGLKPRFALLAIEESAPAPGYVLYIETDGQAPDSLQQQLDTELRANPHYDLCVRLGQLQPTRMVRVGANAYEVYTRRLSELGFRIGNLKPTPLSRHGGWGSYFDAQVRVRQSSDNR